MSRWTHRICADCWIERFIEKGRPARVVAESCPAEEQCCFCGVPIINVTFGHGAIYVRHDPAELLCGGDHEKEIQIPGQEMPPIASTSVPKHANNLEPGDTIVGGMLDGRTVESWCVAPAPPVNSLLLRFTDGTSQVVHSVCQFEVQS